MIAAIVNPMAEVFPSAVSVTAALASPLFLPVEVRDILVSSDTLWWPRNAIRKKCVVSCKFPVIYCVISFYF